MRRQLNVRVEAEVIERLRQIAAAQDRSLNNLIERILRQAATGGNDSRMDRDRPEDMPRAGKGRK